VKIALITDSIACLTKEQQDQYEIKVVPANVLIEGKIYRDGIDLTVSQAYQFLKKNPEAFSTSAPSPGEFLEIYRRLCNKANKIICLTISSKLSATHNSARIAKDLAKTELPNLKIEIIDTLTIGAGQALLILAASREVKEGKNFEKIISLAESLKKRVRVFFIPETIRHIYRTGRIPKIAAEVGAGLSLKPLLEVSDGKFHFGGVFRNKEKGVEKLLQILKENLDFNLPPSVQPEIGVIYADNLPEAESFKKKISDEFGSAKIFLSEFSPIMGYAIGPGVLGIAFYSKK